MNTEWYQRIFPNTRLSRQTVQELATTRNGMRFATSVGGVITGRGADFLIVDDPTKPNEAVSDALRKFANEWCDNTLYSRLNDKRTGCIIVIMQRLHQDDLTGHLLEQEGWKLLSLPAIAEEPEKHVIKTIYGTRVVRREPGDALHSEREPISVLKELQKTMGEYNFAGQYQQSPAPADGGMVKRKWIQTYSQAQLPRKFEMIFQSWDMANKESELADFSVCTTWGLRDKHVYLLDVYRERVNYPDLKRAVGELERRFKPSTILIEDRSSGTPLIQELRRDANVAVTAYNSKHNKVMRLHSVTSTFENGLVHVPEESPWIVPYLSELITFPSSKHDDQVDSTSQALDWLKSRPILAVMEYYNKYGGNSHGLYFEPTYSDPEFGYVQIPPTQCPKCESKAFGGYGKMFHCNACQHWWD